MKLFVFLYFLLACEMAQAQAQTQGFLYTQLCTRSHQVSLPQIVQYEHVLYFLYTVIPGPWRVPVTDSKQKNKIENLLSILLKTIDITRLRPMGLQPQECHIVFLQQHKQNAQMQ